MSANESADLDPTAKPESHETKVKVPPGFAAGAPTPHRSRERIIFRAKSRARTAAIVADAAVEGAPFTPIELWSIVEGATFDGRHLHTQQRVRTIRDTYDSMVQNVAAGEKTPDLKTPAGKTILPNAGISHPFVRAVEMAARAIAEGVHPTDARLSANAELLNSSLDTIVLRPGDRQRHHDAVEKLISGEDSEAFFGLMLDRYDELD